MRLTVNSKTRKDVCTNEKVCAYKIGALNNPSLRYYTGGGCMTVIMSFYDSTTITNTLNNGHIGG